MLPQPPQAEYVYQVNDEQIRENLRSHFKGFYKLLTENKFISDASFKKTQGIERCITGIPYVFQNAVFDYPADQKNWDQCIEEQLAYFKKHGLSFVWYVDENASDEFKQKLTAHGFANVGIFRGVTGRLDSSLLKAEAPKGYTLELVQDKAGLKEFNDLVCSVFEMPDSCKGMYETALWNAMHQPNYQAFNWVAKKEGKVVAALTTAIEGKHVSFWNGATLPELRKTGLSSALRCMALRHALSKGCTSGSSYLMAEGLAYGICTKLGYTTKWRFNAFVSP